MVQEFVEIEFEGMKDSPWEQLVWAAEQPEFEDTSEVEDKDLQVVGAEVVELVADKVLVQPQLAEVDTGEAVFEVGVQVLQWLIQKR